MKRILTLRMIIIILSLWTTSSSAQNIFNQNWVTSGGTPNGIYDFQASHVIGSGSLKPVVVVGNTFHAGQAENFLITKYDGDGGLIFKKEYDGTASTTDFATDVTTIGNNIYVTGVEGDTSTGSTYITTLKLDSVGNVLWTAKYQNSYKKYNLGFRIIPDPTGNYLYVCGTSQTSPTDFALTLLKYKVAGGAPDWVASYDSVGFYDAGIDLKASTSSVVVYGVSGLSSVSGDIITRSYNTSTGALISQSRINNTGAYVTRPVAIAKDRAENIYLAGISNDAGHLDDIQIIKLDSTLTLKWKKYIDGGNSKNDAVTAIKVDSRNNIILSGFAGNADASKAMWTIKMKDSVVVWNQKRLSTVTGKDATANDVDLDPTDNIYVTGKIYTGSKFEYITIQYDSLGNKKWEDIYSYNIASDDEGRNVKIDSGGNIIVYGRSKKDSVYTYVTMQYSKDTTPIAPSASPSQQCAYFKNIGQIVNSNKAQDNSVLYYNTTSNPQVYLLNNKLSYVFCRHDSVIDSLNRVDMSLYYSGSSLKTTPKVFASEKNTPYLNYYIKGLPNFYEGVHGNERLTAKEVYKSIDWQIYSDSVGLKYYFVVSPGGNPSDIQFKYDGAVSTSLSGNALTIATLFGNYIQSAFTATQYTGTTPTSITITCNSLGSNLYSFTLGTYNSTKPLFIQITQQPQPNKQTLSASNLKWCTYFGGTGNGSYQTDMSAYSQNKYLTGHTWCSDFPITTGLVNDTFSNGGASVSKFDGNDFNVWSTFYGTVISTDGQILNPTCIRPSLGLGDANTEAIVYLFGATGSRLIPFVNMGGGAFYDTIYNGGVSDMFLARFDAPSGQLKHSTYIGSNADDFGNSMIVGNNKALFLVGATKGTNWHYVNTRPSSTSFYDSTGLGIIMEFDLYLHLKLSTGFGSSLPQPNNYFTNILDIARDDSNALIITGMTPFAISYSGSNFPSGQPSGSFSQNYPLHSDCAAFIAKFVPHSGLYDTVYNLYYYTILSDSGGYPHKTLGYHVTTDHRNNMYIAGTSTCSGFPIRPLTSTCPATNSGMFISEFSGNGALKYSNLYGGSPALGFGQPPQFGKGWLKNGEIACDRKNNLYVYATNDYPYGSIPIVTPSGYYSNSITCNEIAIVELDSLQNTLWSTQFGSPTCLQYGNNAGGMLVTDSGLYISGGVGPPSSRDSVPNFPIVFETGATNFSTINTYGPPISGELYTDGFVAKFQTVNVPTGISEIEGRQKNQNDLLCYPNPSGGKFTVNLSDFTDNKQIEIFDQVGRLVYSEHTNVDKLNINLSNLSSGMYVVRASDEVSNRTAKIIITN